LNGLDYPVDNPWPAGPSGGRSWRRRSGFTTSSWIGTPRAGRRGPSSSTWGES